jgi:uncharacterized protein (DUF1697 family)
VSDRRVIVLLRAVNVGGCVLRMADLKRVLAECGCLNAQTLLQSGNAVCDVTGRRSPAQHRKLETTVETALESALRITSDVFVRTADEWDDAVAANPFAEATSDPSHMVLMTLKDEPPSGAVQALEKAIKGRERVHGDGRSLFIVYPDGIGTSKYTSAVIEKAIGVRGTARNWNTVRKLQALVHA